ncbi:MAG: GTP 3',8-cyclase MoaA, partial [Candidatus Limnocylindrales bacterium]
MPGASPAFDGRPGLLDRRGRALRDLRISVTDRCNFRCTYCMPAEVFGRDFAFLPHSEVLSYEEIHRLASIAVELGVTKLRITGGEPLVRKALPDLIARLATLRTPEGLAPDLTLTTNASALRPLARPLADAGLQRITVSLDSLDDATFRRMNGVDFPVTRVLDGIAAAREAGLEPIKVNMVVKRGENEASIVPMARWARDDGLVLRYIEYMDVGTANGWRLDDVVAASEIVAAIDAEMPLEAVPASYRGEVANRWRYRDGSGEVGVIASVTQPFCGDC